MHFQMPAESQQAFLDGLKYDARGLVSVIIQDTDSGEVLMLGHSNREAIANALRDGTWWFYSRSRQTLWRKGERSGHIQHIKEIRVDCDGDALLVKVQQEGGACHKGYRSCFFRLLDETATLITDREKLFDPGDVYGEEAGAK